MKGVAGHHGPESCLDKQQCYGEALTGEDTGTAMSSEITQTRRPPLYNEGKGNIKQTEKARIGWLRRSQRPAASVETLYTGIGRSGKYPHQRQMVRGKYQ